MIYTNLTAEQADAIVAQATVDGLRTHVWDNIGKYTVRTGDDVPSNVPQRVIEAWQYRERFTAQQQLAIMQRAIDDADAVMRLSLMSLWTATQGVDLDGERVIQGLAYCVQVGVLTQQEADAIRA